MGAQDSISSVQVHGRILDMYMIYPGGKIIEEHGRIHSLPNQMAGVKINTQCLTVFKHFQQFLRAVIVKGDFRRMDLQGKLHAALVKHIEDRGPQLLNLFKSLLYHFLCGLGE